MVRWQGVAFAGVGAALGVALAIPARRVLAARLAGMADADLASLAGAPAAVFLVVAALACYLPNYPELTPDDIAAKLAYAAQVGDED